MGTFDPPPWGGVKNAKKPEKSLPLEAFSLIKGRLTTPPPPAQPARGRPSGGYFGDFHDFGIFGLVEKTPKIAIFWVF